MATKRRILIIENQFIQFKDIKYLLDNSGYQTFPDENSFIDFIDAIKIHLNRRYTNERRTFFLEKVIEIITKFDPEILIIDHILVGTHDAQDGIDLAVEFRKRGLKQPIIFFSRTELNNIDICDKLPNVTLDKEWIFKGYSGEDILDKKFFDEIVIPKIKSLLPKSVSNKIIEKLNEKRSKVTASSTDVQRAIAEITQTLIGKINESSIAVNEEILGRLNSNTLDSEYLELLKSLTTQNGK